MREGTNTCAHEGAGSSGSSRRSATTSTQLTFGIRPPAMFPASHFSHVLRGDSTWKSRLRAARSAEPDDNVTFVMNFVPTTRSSVDRPRHENRRASASTKLGVRASIGRSVELRQEPQVLCANRNMPVKTPPGRVTDRMPEAAEHVPRSPDSTARSRARSPVTRS